MGKRLTPEQDELLRSYYDQGLLDTQIAALCNRNVISIRNWRYRRGLPANKSAAKKQQTNMDAIAADVAKARDAGMSYGQWRATQKRDT